MGFTSCHQNAGPNNNMRVSRQLNCLSFLWTLTPCLPVNGYRLVDGTAILSHSWKGATFPKDLNIQQIRFFKLESRG
jgi:hypothetical protein